MNNSSSNSNNNKDRFITIKELAEYLSVTPQHIINLRNDKGLPHLKVGGTYRYKWEDVEDWLKKQNKE